MNANHGKKKLWYWFGIGMIVRQVVFCTLVVQAQSPAQLKEMFARAQQQNAQALKEYTWKSRNEVKKNGESKNTQLFTMRYDANGVVQKSQIGGSAPAAMPKGPLMAGLAQKKKEEFIELINDVRRQVEAYSQLSPQKMQAFLASATITARLDQGVVQIQSGNILQLQDSMTIWLDAKTRKQRRVEIRTFLEKNPVKAEIEFSDLPAGPTYQARTVVDYPKEALQLITENFDYERARVSSSGERPKDEPRSTQTTQGAATSVKIYTSTPETVYVGYLPGSYGTVIPSAGWYYPAAWGGVAAANVYGQWGNVAYSGTRAGWANPYTGNVGQGGIYSGVNTLTGTGYNGRVLTNTNVYTGTTVSGGGGVAYNPDTGRASAGQAGAASNAYTGNAAAGARGVNYNPVTGVVSGGAAGATYNAATGQTTAGGGGFAYNTRTGSGVTVGQTGQAGLTGLKANPGVVGSGKAGLGSGRLRGGGRLRR